MGVGFRDASLKRGRDGDVDYWAEFVAVIIKEIESEKLVALYCIGNGAGKELGYLPYGERNTKFLYQ